MAFTILLIKFPLLKQSHKTDEEHTTTPDQGSNITEVTQTIIPYFLLISCCKTDKTDLEMKDAETVQYNVKYYRQPLIQDFISGREPEPIFLID